MVAWTCLLNRCGRRLHRSRIVVCALATATENDMHVMVPAGLYNCSKTLLGNTHECMRSTCSTHGINGNANRAIGAVLEADREGHTRSELTVELRLGSTRADSTPGNEVGNVLRRDGVK